MDGGDGDDRRFTINFSSDGVKKLREAVNEKLKEFWGDYTDETLVEYVVVLLKNGRRKVEAKNELDVFLGDDTDSFIAWLWDHLGSSLHLYSQSLSIQSDEVGNVRPVVQELAGNTDSHQMQSESEEGMSKKLSKPRHRRQWKALVEDVEEIQILKSSIAESDPLKEDSPRKVHSELKPLDSQHGGPQRKRFRSEASGSDKVLSRSIARGSTKEGLRQAPIFAPRRLLQFAVRDAVATSITEPSLKRLRSVVSAAAEDTTLGERWESRRPVTRMSNNMSAVIKAVAEAAEDVKRVGPHVSDRLSHANGMSDISELRDFEEDFLEDRYVQPHHSSYHGDFEEQYVSDTILLPRDIEIAPESGFEYDGYNDMEIRGRESGDFSIDGYVQPHNSYYHSDFKEHYVSDTILLARETEMSPESRFEYDGYNDMEIRGRQSEDFPGDRYGRPHHSSYHSDFKEQDVRDSISLPRDTEMAHESGFEYDLYNDMEIRGRGSKDVSLSSEVLRHNVEDSLIFPCGVANNADERLRKTNSSVFVPKASHKTVTWKSPQYRRDRENVKLVSNKSKAESNVVAVMLNGPLTEANKDCAMLGNGNVKSEAGISKESHKMQLFTQGPCSTGPPTDDSDSRTIFVSNVHFGATKDSLSRNFNKFGEVLKVIILSNPATGLPKGSAYVEFMRKEAAEHALTLDGTSFMTRILKVVRKNAAPPEPSSTFGWPRAARSLPYPISGFSMTHFPRGVPNAYRARPLKPGARSLQWKRDGNSIPNHMSNQASNTSLPAARRGLTYVRTDPKTNEISNNA